MTDNDGDYQNKVAKKYEAYNCYPFIKICADSNNDLKTLEPQIVGANKIQLDTLRKILGIKSEDYPNEGSIADYMRNYKTDCALKIFDTAELIKLPQYILDATTWAHEQE